MFLVEVFIIVFLISLSALFSGSETAITSITQLHAKKILDKQKKSRRKLLEIWIKNPTRILTTLLIGNNIVNILASSLATDVSYKIFRDMLKFEHFESIGIAVAVGIMTVLILIFGELVPKTYAKHNNEKFLIFAPLIMFFDKLFFIFSKFFSGITSPMVKLFGGETEQKEHKVTEEDIEFLIKQGTESGTLDEEKEQLLSSVFEFSDIIVKEIMVPRTEIVAYDIDDSISELFALIKKYKFSRYPVYKDGIDNIIGIFYTKDLLISYLPENPKIIDISQLLHKPFYIPEYKKINELLKEFQKNKTHIAIVIDEYGGTAGLVTLEDILEEIVGEIYDEFDISEEKIKEISQNRYLVNAKTTIDEMEDFFKIKFPEDEDYETISGFIIKKTGRIPEKGSQIIFENMKFTVRDRDEKKIKTIEVEIL